MLNGQPFFFHLSNGLNIMSYFGHIEIIVFHIVPHSFILKVYIETPAVLHIEDQSVFQKYR